MESAKAAVKGGPAKRRKTTGKKAGARGEKRAAPSPYDRLTIDELEALVIERETELAVLHEKFADPNVCRDRDALAALQEEVESLEADLSEVDAVWQKRVESQ